MKRIIALTLLVLGLVMGQKVTIQYWNINTESFGAPAVRALIHRFEQLHPNIKVESRFSQNAYTGLLQNIQTAIAAGNPPDVAQVGYLYVNYVAQNLPFIPINRLIKKYGGAATLGRIPASLLQLGQSGGVQLGVPYSLSNIIVFYNADLFRKAGLDPNNPPKTWAEWEHAAEVIKQKTGKPIYIQLLDDNWSTQAMIESHGGQLLACHNGYYRAAFNSPEAVQAVQFWAGLVKRGLALNALFAQGGQEFLSGQAATDMTTVALRANFQHEAKFDLRATTFPSFGNTPTRLPSGGNVLVVFAKNPKKQEASWKFVQFLVSAEGFTLWTEGTGYLPLIPGLEKDPRYLKTFITQNPIEQVGIDQVPSVVPWVSFPGPNGLAASQALFKATQQALSGQMSAKRALSAAARQVDNLIQGERCN